ncbi:MAG: hypothetical protein HY867_15655 [Chloroflexi bacterium]|nr:hypothetical protein [Chloroflexota bacterium]
MINVNLDVMISSPIGQVFNFVSAPENDFQWQYGALASSALADGVSNNVGSFFRSIGHLMGRRNFSSFEVTEYEQDRKFGFRSLTGPLQLYTSYTFERVDGVTKINLSTQANVVNFFQMDEVKLEKNMRKQGRENLALLKDLLEAT